MMFPNEIIKEILQYYSLQRYYYLFKDNIFALPLITNLVNRTAKIDPFMQDWAYDVKVDLCYYLAEHYPQVWAKDDVLFCETPYGQISFHTKWEEVCVAQKFGLSNEGRDWDCSNLQMQALELIHKFIDENF